MVFEGRDCYSNDIKHTDEASATDCARLCVKTANCKAYLYTPINNDPSKTLGKCLLKVSAQFYGQSNSLSPNSLLRVFVLKKDSMTVSASETVRTNGNERFSMQLESQAQSSVEQRSPAATTATPPKSRPC